MNAMIGFGLGYVAILAVPGPNMLALASVSALRGWRAALPLCLGLAGGATLLAGTIALSFGLAADRIGIAQIGRVVSVILLTYVALLLLLGSRRGSTGRDPLARADPRDGGFEPAARRRPEQLRSGERLTRSAQTHHRSDAMPAKMLSRSTLGFAQRCPEDAIGAGAVVAQRRAVAGVQERYRRELLERGEAPEAAR